jgi:hypothetical protein
VDATGQHGEGRMVDAAAFMRVSDALKDGFAKLAAADLPEPSRMRWQRRLLAITNVAKHDLHRAEEQYGRFVDDFTREVQGAGEAGPVADR